MSIDLIDLSNLKLIDYLKSEDLFFVTEKSKQGLRASPPDIIFNILYLKSSSIEDDMLQQISYLIFYTYIFFN